MHQLTIRGFDDDLERSIRAIARKEGISLNQAVLRLLRKGAGLGNPSSSSDVVGTSLDHLSGTWSDAEAAEFRAAIESFEGVDESMWR